MSHDNNNALSVVHTSNNVEAMFHFVEAMRPPKSRQRDFGGRGGSAKSKGIKEQLQGMRNSVPLFIRLRRWLIQAA